MIYNTLQLLVILGHVCTASGPALVSWCVRAAPPPQVQFLWWPIGVGLIARGLTTIRPVARGRAYSPWLDKHKLTTLLSIIITFSYVDIHGSHGPTVIKLEKILKDFNIQFSMKSKDIRKFMISVYDNFDASKIILTIVIK